MDDLAGGFGHIPLAHGGLGGVGVAAIAEIQGIVAELAHHGELGFGFGQRESHALILGEGGAKCLPLLNIGPGFIDRGLRRGDTFQTDQRPAEIEPRHDGAEGPAFRRHQAFRWNNNIVEEDRSAPDGLGADIIEMGAADAFFGEIDKKGADPVGAGGAVFGTGEDDGGIRLIGGTHGGFLTVEPPAIGRFLGFELQARRIGTAARLRQAETDDLFPCDNSGDPFHGNIPPGMLRDHPAHQGGEKLDIADIEVAIGDRFRHQACRCVIQAHAAEFFRQVRSDQAKRAHFAHQLPVEGMDSGALEIGAGQLFTGKPYSSVAKCQLVVGR